MWTMGRVAVCNRVSAVCDIPHVRCAELGSTLDLFRNLRWYGMLKCIPFTWYHSLGAQCSRKKMTFDPSTTLTTPSRLPDVTVHPQITKLNDSRVTDREPKEKSRRDILYPIPDRRLLGLQYSVVVRKARGSEWPVLHALATAAGAPHDKPSSHADSCDAGSTQKGRFYDTPEWYV